MYISTYILMCILSPETVLKVPFQCYTILDNIHVRPVPKPTQDFSVPKTTTFFLGKKSMSREVCNQCGSSDSRSWLHYDDICR